MNARFGRRLMVFGMIALGLAAFAILPAAANADEKRYPASMCRQFAGPEGFLFFSSLVAPGLPTQSLPRHNPGNTCPPPQAGGCPPCQSLAACRDDPAFSIRVDCPIPKSFPDAGVQNVTVDVIDRHPVLNVECYLTSARWLPVTNTFQTTFQFLVTAGAGNHIQPLSFGAMAAPAAAAHWYISCRLPANSAFVSYFVRE